ncbi:MAG TPA: hypothetical protein ENK18_16615 [Deltaproteobacteria bacterium]|nr:hypothetical protein [Deltaproteobacteria bacterium]
MAHAGGSSEIRRFRVLDVLGRGGYGSIYRAKFAETGREITLRFLCDELDQDPRQIERLQRLHRILAKIRHSTLPNPAELLRLEDRWVVCTEHIRGASLQELLESTTPIPVSIALQLAEATANALHTLHSARDRQGRSLRLVHRGLRPSNLLLTPRGELKLLDFGLPRRGRDPLSGDLPYLPPDGPSQEDGAIDIYALSMVLAELLVGPVAGGAATGATHSTLFEQIDQGLVEAEVPVGVRALVREGIALDPALRPSARTFARVCRILRPGIEEHDLAAWSSAIIPPLIKRRRLIEGDLTGKVIGEEEIGTQIAAPRRPPPPPEVETELAPTGTEEPIIHGGQPPLHADPSLGMDPGEEGAAERRGGAHEPPPAASVPVIRDASTPRSAPSSRERRSLPPGAARDRPSLPPGAARDRPSLPPGAARERRSLPPGATRDRPSLPPGAGSKGGRITAGPDPVSEQLPPPQRTKLQLDPAPYSEGPAVQEPPGVDPLVLSTDFEPPLSEAPTMGLADSFEDGPLPLTPIPGALGEDVSDPETVIRHPLPFASDVATTRGAPDRELLPDEGPQGLGDRPFLQAAESTDDPETLIRDSTSFLQDLQSDELGFRLPSTFGGEEPVDDPETLIRPASFINDAETQKFTPNGQELGPPEGEQLAPQRRWWAIIASLSVVGVIVAAILGGLSMFVGGSAVFGGILISLLTETPESRCTSNVDIGRSFVQEVRLRPRRNAHRLLDDLEAECVAGRIGFAGTVFVIIELRNRGEDGILTDYEQHKVREVMQDWSE